MLSAVTDIDVSNDAFPFNSLQRFYIGHAEVFAQRLSFARELGGEIFVTPDFAEHVFDVLMQAGQPLGLKLVGGEALNALRLEKGFVHWGHEMAYTEAPHQMVLDFVCKPRKAVAFIGRDAYLARKAKALGPVLCSVKLNNPQPLLHHNEPVLCDGEIVGNVIGGGFSATMGTSVGLCLVSLPNGQSDQSKFVGGQWSVLVESTEISADVSTQPFYDPKNTGMLG